MTAQSMRSSSYMQLTDGKLTSGSADGFIIVWNILAGTIKRTTIQAISLVMPPQLSAGDSASLPQTWCDLICRLRYHSLLEF